MNAITIDGSGVHEAEAPEDFVEKLETQEAERIGAEERLQRAREQRGALIQKFEINGETWFIKLLDFVELSMSALIILRDPDGKIRLFDRKVLKSVIVAALHCGVATSETDATPYFSPELAAAYVSEPAMKSLVAALFNHVTELNPEVLPKKA